MYALAVCLMLRYSWDAYFRKKNPRLDAFAQRTESEKVTALLQAASDGDNRTIIRLLAEVYDACSLTAFYTGMRFLPTQLLIESES